MPKGRRTIFIFKQPLINTILTLTAVLLRIVSNPLGNVFQKQLTQKGQHPLLVNFLTYLALSVVCMAIVVFEPLAAWPRQFWIYSVLGGIAGALGNGFLVKALQTGDLSVLGPVNSYKSVVGLIVGFFLLQERPDLWGLAGTALIICGSYYVLDTATEPFSWRLLKRPEIRFRIWAMVLTAIEAVFIKKIILYSSPVAAFVSWCWFGALFSFLFLLTSQVPVAIIKKQVPGSGILKYACLILCIGVMQLTTNYALGHMSVGYALSLFQLSTVISVFLGYRIFREQGIRKKLLGACIMLAGSVVIILFKDR